MSLTQEGLVIFYWCDSQVAQWGNIIFNNIHFSAPEKIKICTNEQKLISRLCTWTSVHGAFVRERHLKQVALLNWKVTHKHTLWCVTASLVKCFQFKMVHFKERNENFFFSLPEWQGQAKCSKNNISFLIWKTFTCCRFAQVYGFIIL